jgi:hypothetical protein
MAVVADHVIKAFAVSARGAIFEPAALWQCHESGTCQDLTTQSRPNSEQKG